MGAGVDDYFPTLDKPFHQICCHTLSSIVYVYQSLVAVKTFEGPRAEQVSTFRLYPLLPGRYIETF